MKLLNKACPSSTCETGASVIGIVNHEGVVAILPQTIEVTDEFIAIASRGNAPEKRFRFTNKCVENGCRQWNGSRCTVIDKVLQMNESFVSSLNLPACDIRNNCRWYHQAAHKACAVCPFIITDSLMADEQEEMVRVTETQALML